MYTKHSAVHEIPAERSVLPWTNDRNWYADTQATLIITDNDEIHAQMSDSHTVMRTRDGGRTWDDLQVTKIGEHCVTRWDVSSGGTGGWEVARVAVQRSGEDMATARTN